ncbi:MAG: hypothetical protein KA170_10415 [Candidatus Promineofilum sp.]|nr:hypothetical protein [Promineifilum sp.]
MFRRVRLGIRLALLLLLALALLAPEWPAFGDPAYRFGLLVPSEERFDYVAWTTEALADKAKGVLDGSAGDLSAEAAQTLVLDYLDQLGQALALEGQIEWIYADPAVSDPAAATAQAQTEVDALRADLAKRQPTAEAVVQNQVAALLRDEGLTVAGQIWPPVFMSMTPTPYLLIVSPRDRIEQVNYASLIPGLATADKEALEQAVFDQLDQSALVVPIGGLGTYPAMIGETSSIDWLTEVTAHEWTHHWLSFQPLGVRYLASPEMRIINETVASLVDREIGPAVMARYYADQLEPVAAQPAETPKQAAPLFDFAAEMGATRIEVDRLLDAGEVEAAEAYMEARRQVFVNHGYAIRKLNQAYFAFYGGYAAEPGGAAGADPIGPMLRELRAASPSLRDFMRDVARVTSYDDLVTLHQRVVGGS